MTSSSVERHYRGYAGVILRLAEFVEERGLDGQREALFYLKILMDLIGYYGPPSYKTIKKDPSARGFYLVKKYAPLAENAYLGQYCNIPDLSAAGCSRVYIYGAGRVGKQVFLELLKRKDADRMLFEGFLVSGVPENRICMGRPVLSWKEYRTKPGDLILLAIGKRADHEEVAEMLREAGVTVISVVARK